MLNHRLIGFLLLILSTHAFVAVAAPPKPFTAVRATSTEFRCLNRTVALGKLLLPAQIKAADGDLLSSPVEVLADPPSSLELLPSTTTSKLLTRSADSACWQYTAESSDFRLASSLTADCDGFCWYEITLDPKRPVALK